jgi:hypothetical protein
MPVSIKEWDSSYNLESHSFYASIHHSLLNYSLLTQRVLITETCYPGLATIN